MPVTYSGGAEVPHPHVFFQVWIDATNGSFDHHHDDAAPHRQTADRTTTRLPARARTDSSGPTTSAPTVPETRGLVLALASGAAAASPREESVLGLPMRVPLGRTERPLLPPPKSVAVL